MASIDRKDLGVVHHHHGTVHVLDLTDARSGSTLEFEAKHVGGLGLKGLLEQLESGH